MRKDGERGPAYVRKVQEDTRRYVEKLINENETLRTLLAKMESEKLSLEEQMLTVREQLDSHRKEQVRLQRQIAEIEADKQQFSKEFESIEQQNSNLANLYVSSYRLHGTLDRQEVLATIQEILINLVGSEEIGIFELDPDQWKLTLAASFGIDEERYRSIPVGSGVIGRVAQTGEAHFGEGKNGDSGSDDRDVTACIALKVDGKVTGAIAVFSLLPQKTGLEALDHELFELLGTHAAVALYSTGLHAKLGAGMEMA